MRKQTLLVRHGNLWEEEALKTVKVSGWWVLSCWTIPFNGNNSLPNKKLRHWKTVKVLQKTSSKWHFKWLSPRPNLAWLLFLLQCIFMSVMVRLIDRRTESLVVQFLEWNWRFFSLRDTYQRQFESWTRIIAQA